MRKGGFSVFTKVTSVFVSIILSIIAFFTPQVPETKTADELAEMSEFFEKYELTDRLYVIDIGALGTIDKVHMAICLQGIVAKTNPCIYIKTNHMDAANISEIEKSGKEIVYKDDEGNNWNLVSLLEEFKDYISDSGYVLYRESYKAEGLNMATNLSAIRGWLAVPESLEEVAINAGLQKKEDFSDDSYNILFQYKFFNKYKDNFNYNVLIHERYDMKGLRDLAIQQGFFSFYIDDDEDGAWFRNMVMNYAGDNTPVLGWVKYEVAFVTAASKRGNMAVPADHCYNNSYLTSFECEETVQKDKPVMTVAEEGKHYCALVFSDGDNVQWIQNGFSEFYQKLNLETDFPMTWTFPPILRQMSPLTVKKIYNDATENNYFIAGVSGIGYMHPSEYPYGALGGFTDLTAAGMSECDLQYLTILDRTPSNVFEESDFLRSLEYYARYDNIEGGVLYFDPDRYAGGKGTVYFVNDKPFVSARLSLWHPGGEGSEVTTQWLDEQAAIVNSYDKDYTSINGYSVINIHPWTISIKNLEYFVNALDDDVVLVTLDEMMNMLNQNIPHKSAEVA